MDTKHSWREWFSLATFLYWLVGTVGVGGLVVSVFGTDSWTTYAMTTIYVVMWGVAGGLAWHAHSEVDLEMSPLDRKEEKQRLHGLFAGLTPATALAVANLVSF